MSDNNNNNNNNNDDDDERLPLFHPAHSNSNPQQDDISEHIDSKVHIRYKERQSSSIFHNKDKYDTMNDEMTCLTWTLERCISFWENIISVFGLYQPDDHEDCMDERLHLFSLENIAIVLSYFVVGIALELTTVPTMIYSIDTLDASATQTTILTAVTSLPWSFKLIYGLLSDCQPIYGKRRKPYIIIGYIGFILCNFILAAFINPQYEAMVILTFLSTCAYLLADVMCDALIVERSKLEQLSHVGYTQATCYIARYFGSILGTLGGTLLYNKADWGWGLSIAELFFLNGMMAMVCVCPFLYHLEEWTEVTGKISLKDQLNTLFTYCQLEAVYKPMCFVYIYNVSMIYNAAWTNFVIEGLGFSDFNYGIGEIFGAIASFSGAIMYRKYFFDKSWRSIYWVTTFFYCLVNLMQIILVKRWNLKIGISDIWFASGDDGCQQLILALQFFPVVRAFIQMCPNGSEGAAYAMLTTLANVASSVAYYLGTYLTSIWDVSNDTLAAGDFDGVLKLTILTSCFLPFSLILLPLLPANAEEQMKSHRDGSSSWWYGTLFAFVLVGSIVYCVVATIIEIAG